MDEVRAKMKRAIGIPMSLLLFGAAPVPVDDTALILGRVVAWRHVIDLGDLPGNDEKDVVYFGAIFDADVRVERVLAGRAAKGRVEVRMPASHLPRRSDRLVMILEGNDKPRYVPWWSRIDHRVCLPPELIAEYGFDKLFEQSRFIDGEQCLNNLRQRQKSR